MDRKNETHFIGHIRIKYYLDERCKPNSETLGWYQHTIIIEAGIHCELKVFSFQQQYDPHCCEQGVVTVLYRSGLPYQLIHLRDSIVELTSRKRHFPPDQGALWKREGDSIYNEVLFHWPSLAYPYVEYLEIDSEPQDV